MSVVIAAIVAGGLGILLGVLIGHFGRRARGERGASPAAATVPPTPVVAPPTVSTQGAQPVSVAALVVEALTTGVIVVDRDERVVLINPAARAMGVTAGDRIGLNVLTWLVRECLLSGTTVKRQLDLPMNRLGREPIALSASAIGLHDHSGQTRAVALLIDDVTEARRLEAVRRDFVANVSHELKTPVGALTLLAEAVESSADDPDAVARFAARMQHEGTRLSRLVGELIELSRLEGAESLPGKTEVSVQRVLDEAADRARLAATDAGIRVVVNCAVDLVVRGNETQLANAVTNLVDNAIAYSPDGTRVLVNARASTDGDGEACVEISVSDQGIGISEADLPRVFERFYRIDPARSRATGGTGLGLAIVKHVANNHGGTVDVWSVEGSGSTFTIRLPLVNPGLRTSTPSTSATEGKHMLSAQGEARS